VTPASRFSHLTPLTYDRRQLFLYSALAWPGNSSGPILSISGHVIGLVSNSLHHRDQPDMAEFYADIPTSQILQAVQDLAPYLELRVEEYR
jgi:hypothetical protein